jgi:NADH-quinone oxidoreductase subunit L
VLLAIPSVIIGYLTISPLLFGGAFGESIFVRPENDTVSAIGRDFEGPIAFVWHAFAHPPLYLALAGVLAAWLLFLKSPSLADALARPFGWLRRVLENKYFFDWVNENVLAAGSRLLGRTFWKAGDQAVIDGALVNGSAAAVGWLAGVTRWIQSGFLYSYAFWMVLGLAGMLSWFLFRAQQ